MAKKDKISIIDLERERFSNFVVDLRRAEHRAIPDKGKESKKFGRKLANQLEKIEIAVKKIKPNLLQADKPRRSAYLNQLKLRSFFHRWRPGLIVKKAEQNPWLKLVKERERIFNAPPSLNSKRKNFFWFKRFIFKHSDSAEDRSDWQLPLFSFVLVLVLIIFFFNVLSRWPLSSLADWEERITGRSVLAVNNLLTATDFATKLNFQKADINFQQASLNFLGAANDLNRINDNILSLATLSNNPKIKLAAESKKFINAGVLAASLGHNLVLATDSLFNGNTNSFSVSLDNFLNFGHQAVGNAQSLKQEVNQINLANLPPDYRVKFATLRDQVSLLADNLNNFVTLGDKLKEFFGLSRDKRYLLVFQNNAELRASGGFLGSYALVDLRDGKIINLEVPGGGSYDTEGGMKVNVAAPEPLWLVNPLWHFWDANWWPDWPTTAQNLMWFYEKSAGPSVDGVISVTPTVVEGLLEITGPIDLSKEYGLIIGADNFWEAVQTITEQKNLIKTNAEASVALSAVSLPLQSTLPLQQGLEVNSANKPKKIIGDLMTKILEVLPQKLTKDNLLKIINLFEKSLSAKQILFYFTDPNLEATVASRNWAGEIQTTARDYLLVVDTNIAGQKSDRLISEKIDQSSEVESDGTIINTVEITRTHHGINHAPLTGVRNVDWLRVYVPAGSELLSATGFQSPDAKYLQEKPDPGWEHSPLLVDENKTTDPRTNTKIYQEKGKTVFANWTMLDPGQSTIITLRYRLPFNFFDSVVDSGWLKKINTWLNPDMAPSLAYSLMVQKQSGATSREFTGRLILPQNQQIFWRYPETLNGINGWEIKDQLDSDKYYAILFKTTHNY
ncbi:MAG: DUF4012 domain-containing protein [Patescibacteria group bacterium]|jgi:hypothetical protein